MGEIPMSVVLWISYSSPFLKSPCIHDVFTRMRVTLLPIPPVGFNQYTDGALVDAWLYFPGLKVGTILFLFSLTI